ncbi:homoserine dehydrogenase [Synergistaceae bacterium OttesenSCG-928-D05]|nr:homoserine dehydrogenase [Synergistaceae bacterium OttesenSCG-928-D05]
MIHKIALAGCGNVGTALLEILHEKKEELAAKYNFNYKVTFVTDLMKGTVVDPEGIDLGKLLENIRADRSFARFPQSEGTFHNLLEKSKATMLAEATPTNLKTGEPGLTHIRAALSRGISATTTNKGPVAIAYDELQKLAKDCGAKFRYEGVVMSGTPLLQMLENGLAGANVIKIEGILNGTTNFILTKMDEGMTYAAALEEATNLGYAEADPSGDVEGWDAAVKVSILAKILFGKEVPVSDIHRIGITDITPDKIAEAKEAGYRVKLIAGIKTTNNNLECYVMPKEIPLDAPLASIGGATNAVTVTTDNLGDVTLIGPGAGRKETGQALLTDLVAMA